jgi:hypothetical protein
MTFYIQGSTKCAICEQFIGHRFEAAQLTYGNPTELGSLAMLSRRFVHRKCWLAWDHAQAFSRSAFDLVSKQPNASVKIKKIFAQNNLYVSWIETLNCYQCQDFDLLVTVEIPQEHDHKILDFLIAEFTQPPLNGKYQFGNRTMEVTVQGEDLEFTLLEEAEILDRYILYRKRWGLWRTAFDEIIKREEGLRS